MLLAITKPNMRIFVVLIPLLLLPAVYVEISSVFALGQHIVNSWPLITTLGREAFLNDAFYVNLSAPVFIAGFGYSGLAIGMAVRAFCMAILTSEHIRGHMSHFLAAVLLIMQFILPFSVSAGVLPLTLFRSRQQPLKPRQDEEVFSNSSLRERVLQLTQDLMELERKLAVATAQSRAFRTPVTTPTRSPGKSRVSTDIAGRAPIVVYESPIPKAIDLGDGLALLHHQGICSSSERSRSTDCLVRHAF